jgi:putative ATPase
MELFEKQERATLQRAEPLATRMRARCFDEFVGQRHLLDEGKLLRRMIEADALTGAVFFGPAGTGKTTLAHIIAAETHAEFIGLDATEAGVRDVRSLISTARDRLLRKGQPTLLFLDEMHRFNRGQQDSLLKAVENGVLRLIGATTENPFFCLNSAVLSRCELFEFKPLDPDSLAQLCRHALQDTERGLGGYRVTWEDGGLDVVIEAAHGDARRALSMLDILVRSQKPDETGVRHVTLAAAVECARGRRPAHDRSGDAHYDIVSAFIKSMRGSDPDAALYWMVRLLDGGDDPRFVARRIAICASEDVGNADSHALLIAAAAANTVERVGLPECEYALAHAAIYVACAPKSNAITRALQSAHHDVREAPPLPVPDHLRDASYGGAARLGRGEGYQYPHDFPGGVCAQDYLGQPKSYYNPTDRGDERRIAALLADIRRRKTATDEIVSDNAS